MTPLNIIYNSISRHPLCVDRFLATRHQYCAGRLPRLSSPCQRLELHYRTNRSPKAANELVGIRWARRLESTTRLSLVNLGIICRRFGTIRHHRRPFSARYKKIEKFHSPPLFSYPNLELHKSRFIFRRLCVPTLLTYISIYLHSSTFRLRKARLVYLFTIWEMRLLNLLVSLSKPTVEIKYPALAEGVQSRGAVI